MFRALGCSVIVLALGVVGLEAQAGKGGKEVEGTVKQVDAAKSKFTITLKDGKDRTFEVNKDTKFVGPQGGMSKEGLKDDRMTKGYEVKVVPAADNKTAAEVKLPLRKKKAKDKN
jgi:hypothetical protein